MIFSEETGNTAVVVAFVSYQRSFDTSGLTHSPPNPPTQGGTRSNSPQIWGLIGRYCVSPEEVLELLSAGKAPSPVEAPEIPAPAVERLDQPPLPVAEPNLPEGQVDLASAFYVERPPIESRCYEALAKPGSLIRTKAPRQMGKTSLMARILQQAEAKGCLKVPLSFQLADDKVFADLDQFLRWFCASVGRRLRLPNKLADYWDEIFGSKDNCTAYFEEYLLNLGASNNRASRIFFDF